MFCNEQADRRTDYRNPPGACSPRVIRHFNSTEIVAVYIMVSIITPDEVLRTVLALYMEDEKLPLPTLEEVLICNSSTTTEEVCSTVEMLYKINITLTCRCAYCGEGR